MAAEIRLFVTATNELALCVRVAPCNTILATSSSTSASSVQSGPIIDLDSINSSQIISLLPISDSDVITLRGIAILCAVRMRLEQKKNNIIQHFMRFMGLSDGSFDENQNHEFAAIKYIQENCKFISQNVTFLNILTNWKKWKAPEKIFHVENAIQVGMRKFEMKLSMGSFPNPMVDCIDHAFDMIEGSCMDAFLVMGMLTHEAVLFQEAQDIQLGEIIPAGAIILHAKFIGEDVFVCFNGIEGKNFTMCSRYGRILHNKSPIRPIQLDDSERWIVVQMVGIVMQVLLLPTEKSVLDSLDFTLHVNADFTLELLTKMAACKRDSHHENALALVRSLVQLPSGSEATSPPKEVIVPLTFKLKEMDIGISTLGRFFLRHSPYLMDIHQNFRFHFTHAIHYAARERERLQREKLQQLIQRTTTSNEDIKHPTTQHFPSRAVDAGCFFGHTHPASVRSTFVVEVIEKFFDMPSNVCSSMPSAKSDLDGLSHAIDESLFDAVAATEVLLLGEGRASFGYFSLSSAKRISKQIIASLVSITIAETDVLIIDFLVSKATELGQFATGSNAPPPVKDQLVQTFRLYIQSGFAALRSQVIATLDQIFSSCTLQALLPYNMRCSQHSWQEESQLRQTCSDGPDCPSLSSPHATGVPVSMTSLPEECRQLVQHIVNMVVIVRLVTPQLRMEVGAVGQLVRHRRKIMNALDGGIEEADPAIVLFPPVIRCPAAVAQGCAVVEGQNHSFGEMEIVVKGISEKVW